MNERLKARSRIFSVITLTAAVSACAGGGVASSPGANPAASGDRSTDSGPRLSPLTLDDARRLAQHRTYYFKQLTVRPKALFFSTDASLKIAVSIPKKTTVYAAADDQRIVSVSPPITQASRAGTITLTVTPNANGRAFVGILDSDFDYAVISVSVDVSGMPTPVPSATPSAPPSPTPTPIVTVTPIPTATPTGPPTVVPPPTPTPSSSPTPTPVITVTPVPTVRPT